MAKAPKPQWRVRRGAGLRTQPVTVERITFQEDPEGPWLTTVELALIDGIPAVVGFARRSYQADVPPHERVEAHTFPEHGLQAVQSSTLRSIKVPVLLREAVERAGRSIAWDERAGMITAQEAQEREEALRGRTYDMRFYRRLSAIYNEASRDPTETAPTKAVARAFKMTPSTAANHVSIARNQLGLIPKTTPGRASIAPTPQEGNR